MSDLDKTSAAFFNRMRDNPVPSEAPSPWYGAFLQYFQGNQEKQPVVAQPIVAKPNPSQAPTDPYMNFANKVTGQPYK